MQPATATLGNLEVLPQRLEVVDTGDQRTVFLNGYAAARYACEDKVTERVLLTQLAEVLPLPDLQIAAAVQIHPVTLSRLRAMGRTGGTAALIPSNSGPKGPQDDSQDRGLLPGPASAWAFLSRHRAESLQPSCADLAR